MNERLRNMINRPLRFLGLLIGLGFSSVGYAHPDPMLSHDKISGVLSAVGSDTLAPLMSEWAQAFQRQYPETFVQVQAVGSSSVPAALTQSVAQIGSMTRPMNNTELQNFKRQFGYEPLQIPFAIDALSIFVNKENPLESIDLHVLDGIFSKTLRCGGVSAIDSWDQLGVGSSAYWQDRPIRLFGRTAVSGTYGFFKENVLCRGDFTPRVNELLGASSVVHQVAQSKSGIGYGRLDKGNFGVKYLAIKLPSGEVIPPTEANLRSRQYPLTRDVYLYVNRVPNTSLSPMLKSFLAFVLSNKGQDLVKKEGYVPLSEAKLTVLRRQLN
jgi:phosphate transport system substrate-binding protein